MLKRRVVASALTLLSVVALDAFMEEVEHHGGNYGFVLWVLAPPVALVLGAVLAALTPRARDFALLAVSSGPVFFAVEGARQAIAGASDFAQWSGTALFYWGLLSVGPLVVGGALALGLKAIARARKPATRAP